MSEITVDDVKNIADLIRIEVSDEEAKSYTERIKKILNDANKLSELNTDDVKPTTHGTILTDVMRKDVPKRSLTQKEALKNAPDQQDGHFKVPSIMD